LFARREFGILASAMKMTGRRRIVIWVWIAAVLAAGVFPPWAQGGYPRGYYLLFSPLPTRAHIDSSRLNLEWVLISAVALGFLFAWPERTARKAPPQTLPAPPTLVTPSTKPPVPGEAPQPGQSYPMANGTALVKSVDNGIVTFEHTQPGGQVVRMIAPLQAFQKSITPQEQTPSGSQVHG
jgi:hypothetical protein